MLYQAVPIRSPSPSGATDPSTGAASSSRPPASRDVSEDDDPFRGFLPGRCAILVALCVAALLAILGCLSFAVVPPLAYGISYNVYSKVADPYVYHCGRHLIGPFKNFFLFNATAQTIEFTDFGRLQPSGVRQMPLLSRTSDGLAIALHVAIQYRLYRDELVELYNTFGLDYGLTFTSTIRDALMRGASDFQARQLWLEREAVGAKMRGLVENELRPLHAECWGLQLLCVDLPPNFEDSILNTQVQRQLRHTRSFEQSAALVRAETAVIASNYSWQVRVLTAHGQANATVLTRRAAATAQQRVIRREAQVLGRARQRLGLEGPQLVDFQRYTMVDHIDDAVVFSGFAEDTQWYVAMEPPEVPEDGAAEPERERPPAPLYPYSAAAWATSVRRHDAECRDGRRQSPVDLPRCWQGSLRPAPEVEWGHRVHVDLVNDGEALSVVPSGSVRGHLYVGQAAYVLLSCRFHMGSEHRVGGQQFPLEMQCVHSQEGQPARRSVVAVLFLLGPPSPFLAAVVDHLPRRPPAASAAAATSPWHGPVDFQVALPQDLRQYWSYQGSSTMPPCEEGVGWLVLMTPATLSPDQHAKLDVASGWGAPPAGGNYRPPQPLHGRTVEGC